MFGIIGGLLVFFIVSAEFAARRFARQAAEYQKKAEEAVKTMQKQTEQFQKQAEEASKAMGKQSEEAANQMQQQMEAQKALEQRQKSAPKGRSQVMWQGPGWADSRVPSVVVSGEERFHRIKNRFIKIKIRIAPKLLSSQ